MPSPADTHKMRRGMRRGDFAAPLGGSAVPSNGASGSLARMRTTTSMEEVLADHVSMALEVRTLPVYICFEEPASPLVWPKDQVVQMLVDSCDGHRVLGCGWFTLVPV